MAGVGGLGGLGGFDVGNLFAALGQSLLTSPRTNMLQGLPAGIQAANERMKQSGSDAAMVMALTKAGIDPQTAATLALNPTAAALMISQTNAQKQQKLQDDAIRSIGSGLVPPGAGDGGSVSGVGPSAEAEPSPTLPRFAQMDAAKRVGEKLIQRGVDPMVAAGMVGNIAGESGFNTGAVGDNGTSLGFIQARGPRAEALKALAAQQGKSWKDEDVQVDHIVAELNGPEKAAYERAKQAKDAGQAAYILAKHYERPAAWALAQSAPKRMAVAEQTYGSLGGLGGVRVAQADTGTATDALPTNQFAGPGAKIPAAASDRTLPAVTGAPSGTNATKAWANAQAQNAMRLMIAAGDNKGLMEAAKARFDVAKGYLTQSEAERNLAAAGISPTSRIGREVLTGGVGIKLQQHDLEERKFGQEREKFDFDRYQKDREYRQQVDNANRTTGSKEYDLYAAQERSAGREPKSRFDYDVALKTAGASKIDLGEKRQSAFDQERDKVNIKRFSGMIEEGDSASSDLSLIRQLRQMGGAIDQKSLPALRGWLAEKGIKIGDDIGVIEAYNSVIDRMVPAQRQGLPGAASDRDMNTFRGAINSLLKTPGGNAIVSDTMEALAIHKQQRAAIADQVIQGRITPEQGTEAIRSLPDPLSTFKDFRSEGITAESENAPKQPPLIYTGKQYDALPVGSPYRDAKGQLRQKKAERPRDQGAQ